MAASSGRFPDAAEISRRHVVRLAERWISAGQPAALVRFGEGEGRILAADPADELSVNVARRKLRKQTGLRFPTGEILELKALIADALDRADVVGIRDSARFSSEHREWMELIGRVYAERSSLRSRPTFVSHCLFHHDLYEALPNLIAGRRVSVVSCRDVGEALASTCQTPAPTIYQVPSQFATRQVDGAYEAALHGTAIWPRFYAELVERLSVGERGEVFLVGAGVFGKSLCIAIRERGGIALDLGSTLDQMASKVTRGPSKPESYRSGPPPKATWATSPPPTLRRRLSRRLAAGMSRLALWGKKA